MADAIVRVFIEHGDRTDRKKARLKYVLDAWGLEKFLAEVEAKLGASARAACRRKGLCAQPPGPQRAHRLPRPEAGRQGLGRRCAARRQADRRADARPGRDRATSSATAISA